MLRGCFANKKNKAVRRNYVENVFCSSAKIMLIVLQCLLFLALTACGTGTPMESGTDPTAASGTSSPVTASSAEPTENTTTVMTTTEVTTTEVTTTETTTTGSTTTATTMTEPTTPAMTTEATTSFVSDESEVKALWCLEFVREASEPCLDKTGIYLAADRAELQLILESISAACGDADQFPVGHSVFPDCEYLCAGETAYSDGSMDMLYSAAGLAGEFDDTFFNGAKAVIIAETVPYMESFASGRGRVSRTEDGLLLLTEMVRKNAYVIISGSSLYVSCWRVEDSAWENGSLTYETMYGRAIAEDQEIRKLFRFQIPAPVEKAHE